MNIKKSISLLAFLLLLSINTVYAMPNPIVEYPSQTLAEREANFPALTVPLKSSYTLQRAAVIGQKLIELEYLDSENRTVIIRTARLNKKNPNISGIYTDKWYAENIGCLYMHIAHLDNKQSASYWNDNKYMYAIIVKNIEPKEFLGIAAPIYEGINPPM